MSLIAFAIRIATVKMLRGATLAGVSVFDSPLDPVPQALGATTPLIHVYTEGETLKTECTRDLLQGNRSVNLTLQIFIPVDQEIAFGDQNVKISSRRGGGQAVLDIIYRQVEAALIVGQSPWHDLFRRLVDGYRSVSSRPYVIQTDKGVRLAAREIEFVCDTQSSPNFGPVLSGLWGDFITAMQGDDDLKLLAPFVEAEIAGAGAPSQSDFDAFLLGLSNAEAAAVGVTLSNEDVDNDPGQAEVVDQILADPDAPLPDGYVIAP